MENITPDEVRQIKLPFEYSEVDGMSLETRRPLDIDKLASKIAKIKPIIEYVDILDRPPQLGCAYAIRILDKDSGICLCVKDRPSNQPMFVSANGDARIGGVKEETIFKDECKTIKYPISIPNSYELNREWIFQGLLFKIDLERAKPHDIMLKLLK